MEGAFNIGEIMKFVFPQNYKYSNKILGIIDYSTAIANVVWYIIVLFIINILFKSISIKIFIFVLLCFPVFLMSIVGFNHENIIFVILYVIKFFKNRKIYLYL